MSGADPAQEFRASGTPNAPDRARGADPALGADRAQEFRASGTPNAPDRARSADPAPGADRAQEFRASGTPSAPDRARSADAALDADRAQEFRASGTPNAPDRARLHMERRVVPLTRTTEARLVPTGTPVTIPGGAFVTLTQSLGNAYTVVWGGNMARIDGENADALGFEPVMPAWTPPADGAVSEAQVREALATVHDPEIPVNIVDLGLVYRCDVDGGRVDIDMTLTAPGCGMGPVLVQDVEQMVARVPFVTDVTVNLVFDPPWSRDMMTEEAQLELGLY